MAKLSNAYIQYSKRITTTVAAAWICFRVITILLISLIPLAADAFLQLQKGADDVMIIAIGLYCGNSVAEKGIIGYFQKKNTTESQGESESELNG